MNCQWKEYSCKKDPIQDGFCKAHRARGVVLAEAEKKEVRVCDDARRACRNITTDGKLKCDVCLAKTREKENTQYKERKDSDTKVCTQCGVSIEAFTIGIHGHQVQKCEYCYQLMREIEENRVRAPRNYSQERKANPIAYYRAYIDSGASRNLPFTLSLHEFTSIVNKPCFYCKAYNEKEVHGIDRLNSKAGYILENCVPCCYRCNFMKQDMSVDEFAKYICQLFATFASPEITKTIPSIPDLPEHSSYSYRPKEIVSFYVKKQLDRYITLCEKESRDDEYITFLKDQTTYTKTKQEFRSALFKQYQSELRTKYFPSSTISCSNAAPIPIVCESLHIEITPLAPVEDMLAPAQWKVTNIYSYMQSGKGSVYLSYLKESNPELTDIEERFLTLSELLKSKTKEDSEKEIEDFVKGLRRLRHNALCYKKNHKVLDRDDREVWRADTVLHAFQTNRLDEFKKFTEENVGDKPDDPVWMKRWERFVEGVRGESDVEKKKGLISKFFIAQRMKKYRRANIE